MREQYHKWYSGRLGKEFEMLTFGFAGVPLLLFPTSKGSYYQYRDFGLIEKIEPYIKEGKVKVYCPASYDKDCWYNQQMSPAEKVQNYSIFEDFLLNEIVYPAMEETKHNQIIVAGCSFGAYHAANFAFRHPNKVSHLFALSGKYDMRMFLEDYFDDIAYFNNPVDYLPNLQNEWYLQYIQRMGIVISTAEYDFCKPDSFKLANILQEKNINHWLDVKQGETHDWHFWNEALPTYLDFALKTN